MATLLPSHIIRRCLIRLGAYQGQSAAVEASYIKANPADDSTSESFVPSSFTDELVTVEQEIAGAVALNTGHPWRNVLHDVTASIASGGVIPTVGVSSATAKIIGEYGEIRDAASPFRTLTPDLPEADIRALGQNPGTMFISDVFSYSLHKPRLNHTRANAIIDVCVFDYDVRLAAIAGNSALLFTEAANAYFSGVMSLLKNTDALLSELSGLFQPRYEAWLRAYERGQTELAK